MPPTNLLLCLFLCLHLSFVNAQQNPIRQDMISADSVGHTVKYHKDIYRLTRELTSPFSTDLLKARAIFIWITDNIAYNIKLYNKMQRGWEPKGFVCKDEKDCEQVRREWEMKFLGKVLRKKKTVCGGYSLLFKKMCELAGLRAEVIPGYTKNKSYQIGSTGPLNHAWNAVWIDNRWLLLDATWAAGVCKEIEETGELWKFEKAFNEYYWNTSFEDLSRNHYPKEPKWTLVPHITKEKYMATPFIHGGLMSSLEVLSPNTGMVEAKLGDTIHFRLRYSEYIGKLQINSNLFRNMSLWKKTKSRFLKPSTVEYDTFAASKQRYVDFTRKGDFIFFDYVVTGAALEYMEVLFEHVPVMRFKVKVLKPEDPRTSSLSVEMIDKEIGKELARSGYNPIRAEHSRVETGTEYSRYVDSVITNRSVSESSWLSGLRKTKWLCNIDTKTGELAKISETRKVGRHKILIEYEYLDDRLVRIHYHQTNPAKNYPPDFGYYYISRDKNVYSRGTISSLQKNSFGNTGSLYLYNRAMGMEPNRPHPR